VDFVWLRCLEQDMSVGRADAGEDVLVLAVDGVRLHISWPRRLDGRG